MAESTVRYNNTIYCLLEELMSKHPPYVRPVEDHHAITNLTVEITVDQLIDVDDLKQTVTISYFLLLRWQDEYLVWNPNDYGGIQQLNIPDAYQVWKPSFQAVNKAKDLLFADVKVEELIVQHNGTVLERSIGVGGFLCSMDMTHYPSDEHNCSFYFFTWDYPSVWISEATANGGQFLFDNSQFNLSAIKVEAFGYYVALTISMERFPEIIEHTLLNPMKLLSVLVIFTLLLPPDSDLKLETQISIMLSLAVYLMIISEHVPQSRQTPTLLSYIAYGMIANAGCMIIAIIVRRITSIKDLPMPAPIYRVICIIGLFLLVPSPKPTNLCCGKIRKPVMTDEKTDVAESGQDGTTKARVTALSGDDEQVVKLLSKICYHLVEGGAVSLQWYHLGAVIDRITFITVLLMWLVEAFAAPTE